MKASARSTGVLFVLVGLLAGCEVNPARLYAVDRPLAKQPTLPGLSFNPSIVTSGPATLTTADGKAYQSPRTLVQPDDPSAKDLAADWDRVYGPGFFVAKILGSPLVERFTFTGVAGVQGGKLEIEALRVLACNCLNFGVARDDQANVFKVAF